ncbi:MAG: HD domain-containing protein [Thermoanaerobaculia bacterium]|nr:HD domain-containing protein [Thermoanaerobaculia bacterium]
MGLTYVRMLQDPMWGPFQVTEVEVELLATPAVARLEQIKQMGVAFLDYPSLTHTRLEHSLGVMYVADKLYRMLRETTRNRSDFTENERRQLFDDDTHQAVRIAALLHDLGHPPFSHAIELTFLRYPSILERARLGLLHGRPTKLQRRKAGLLRGYSHEKFTKWTINNSRSIRKILRTRFRTRPELRKEIADLAIGKAPRILAPFNGLISGDFDADKIDYLIRDNRRSGFAIGLSPDELYQSIHLSRIERKGDGAPAYDLYIDRAAMPFVNSVLASRGRLVRRVHLARLGRTATQMLTRFLSDDLHRIRPRARLAETIIEIHTRCTDFTFFERIIDRLPKKSRARKSARHVGNLVRRPSEDAIWEEALRIRCERMHPSLRLWTYIAATRGYEKSDDALVRDPAGNAYFVEPSVRPAPKFSLQVDFECSPENPGFDFIAGNANLYGRAILLDALSSLDIFAYKLGKRPRAAGRRAGRGADPLPECAEMCTENLNRRERLAAEHVIRIALSGRGGRRAETSSLHHSEFLLALLHGLHRHVLENWPGARGVYVYRAEYFIKHFMRRLAHEKRALPSRFQLAGRGPLEERRLANRVFSEIQRLNAYGLIETRRRPLFHSSEDVGKKGTDRTRSGTYSMREDFRLGVWGRDYLRCAVAREVLAVVESLVEERQSRIRCELAEMAEIYGMELQAKSGLDTEGGLLTERVMRFHRRWSELEGRLWDLGGCAMIFSVPGGGAGGSGPAEAS